MTLRLLCHGFKFVFRLVDQYLGGDQILDDRNQQLLCSHAVVGCKPQRPKGCSTENAHPAPGFQRHNIPQKEVHSNGNADGQGRKNELPHGQPKEDCFVVVAYFSVDFDFRDNSSIFCFNSSKNLAYNELKGACALWYNVI